MKKGRLNDVVRNKIAIEVTLNPKKTHKEISEFYGISRQLVTLIAKEYNLKRTNAKGLVGSYTHPIKNKANIEQINDKFSGIDERFENTVEKFYEL